MEKPLAQTQFFYRYIFTSKKKNKRMKVVLYSGIMTRCKPFFTRFSFLFLFSVVYIILFYFSEEGCLYLCVSIKSIVCPSRLFKFDNFFPFLPSLDYIFLCVTKRTAEWISLYVSIIKIFSPSIFLNWTNFSLLT